MTKKLWGGRFGKETDSLAEEFTRSISYDHKLAKYDVLGSLYHLTVLKDSKLITPKDAAKLGASLKKIYDRMEKNRYSVNEDCEDIHTDIQNTVEKDVGELALKLHTARSRNDQVLFDLKLFSIAEVSNIEGLCLMVIQSLKRASRKVKGVIMPGFTHLQHAQLVYLSDYVASFVEMLKRDCSRLRSVKENIALCFGSGALAGTPIYAKLYNKKMKGLKITSPANSLDTVSDRDFVIEILSALSILGMHLSRLSEDLIIWSTKEFGFVTLDDAFAQGSSLMPQKKNPDVLELIRGHTGTLYGNLVSVLTMMKGLPLTYNRDMQLDKPPLFNSFEIMEKALRVLPGLISTLKWNKGVIAARVREDETIYSTDLVYHLVKKGMPFKKAHDIIGKLVKSSVDAGSKISDMGDEELKLFSDKLKHSEVVKLMDPVVSVRSRVSVKRPKATRV
ncbi:MAG: argininosuccinate lyase [Candidatus Omnitrophota bacterium]